MLSGVSFSQAMTSEKGSSNFLSPSSMSPTSSASSSGNHPPPPYRFHQLPHTPTSSRPPSRSNSPPHGGSLPSLGSSNSNSSTGAPGTFAINLGRYGGYYIFRIPITMQRMLGILLRRWKTVIFVIFFGTLAAFGMFGAMWTEWREMTYYR